MNISFTENQLLFGWNPTTGIVSLELESDEHVRIYRRTNGRIVSELQDFRPSLWICQPDLFKNYKGEVEIIPL